LAARLVNEPPDLFIGVDAPDFNLGLEMHLRRSGIRTLHYVSPSFWAWRPKKLTRLKAAANHVLCLFPFEPQLLAEAGIAATYVGHPLAQTLPFNPDPQEARKSLNILPEGPVLAILPGSRAAEIQYLASRFFAAASILCERYPTLQLIVPVVSHLMPAIQAAAQKSGIQARLNLIEGQSQQALSACDVALVASGTATLEAALLGRAMVIAYAMPAFSYKLMLMRYERQLPWIGLPNILCAPTEWLHRPADIKPKVWAARTDAPFVVPELIQDAATPQALAQAVQEWLANPEKVAHVQQRFSQLHSQLYRDTAKLTADAIESIIT
jgi:lipid-A-disaccharide synthase